MQSQTIPNFGQSYNDVHHAVGVIAALKDAYSNFLGVANKAFAMVLVACFIPLLRLFLLYVRKVKVKQFYAQLSLFSSGHMDTTGYSHLRTTFDKIGSDLNQLNQFHQIDLKKSPWIIRGLLKDIQKLIDNLLTWHRQFSDILSALDSEIDESGTKFFKIVPESQLWERRTKAYAYKL